MKRIRLAERFEDSHGWLEIRLNFDKAGEPLSITGHFESWDGTFRYNTCPIFSFGLGLTTPNVEEITKLLKIIGEDHTPIVDASIARMNLLAQQIIGGS